MERVFSLAIHSLTRFLGINQSKRHYLRRRAASYHPAAPGEPVEQHAAILKYLLPFVWPKGRPDLKLRLVLAAAALIGWSVRIPKLPGGAIKR